MPSCFKKCVKNDTCFKEYQGQKLCSFFQFVQNYICKIHYTDVFLTRNIILYTVDILMIIAFTPGILDGRFQQKKGGLYQLENNKKKLRGGYLTINGTGKMF